MTLYALLYDVSLSYINSLAMIISRRFSILHFSNRLFYFCFCFNNLWFLSLVFCYVFVFFCSVFLYLCIFLFLYSFKSISFVKLFQYFFSSRRIFVLTRFLLSLYVDFILSPLKQMNFRYASFLALNL